MDKKLGIGISVGVAVGLAIYFLIKEETRKGIKDVTERVVNKVKEVVQRRKVEKPELKKVKTFVRAIPKPKKPKISILPRSYVRRMINKWSAYERAWKAFKVNVRTKPKPKPEPLKSYEEEMINKWSLYEEAYKEIYKHKPKKSKKNVADKIVERYIKIQMGGLSSLNPHTHPIWRKRIYYAI